MNWKTTLSGLISAAGQFVMFSAAAPFNIHYPVVVSALAAFMSIGGLVGLGLVGKDKDVSGGTRLQ